MSEIKTKYNINDTTWIIHNNKVEEVCISKINIVVTENNKPDISYKCSLEYLCESTTRKECNIFKSKIELLNSL